MEPVSVSAHVEQFLTAIHARADADASMRLRQSMDTWLSYYRYLRMTLGRNYNPSVVELIRTSFYPFAQAVLNHFSATFCSFFQCPWQHVEMTHTHLTRTFAHLCAEHGLQGDAATLHAVMHELHARVVAPRTDDRACSIPWSRDDASALTPREDFNEILTLLDQYIVAMLGFFAQNIEHSVFQSTLRSDACTRKL